MGQHTERVIFAGKMFHYGFEVIDLGSASTVDVTFSTAYNFTPAIYVVTPRGAAGTYSHQNESAGGFQIVVSSETDADFQSKKIPLFFFCHER